MRPVDIEFIASLVEGALRNFNNQTPPPENYDVVVVVRYP
jgi:hypothetical protein